MVSWWMEEYAQVQGEALQRDYACAVENGTAHPVTPELDARCRKAMARFFEQDRRHRKRRRIWNGFLRAAMVALSLVGLSGTVIFSVEALRESFISMLTAPQTAEVTVPAEETADAIPESGSPLTDEDNPLYVREARYTNLLCRVGNHAYNENSHTVSQRYVYEDENHCKLEKRETWICMRCGEIRQEYLYGWSFQHERTQVLLSCCGSYDVWAVRCANCFAELDWYTLPCLMDGTPGARNVHLFSE